LFWATLFFLFVMNLNIIFTFSIHYNIYTDIILIFSCLIILLYQIRIVAQTSLQAFMHATSVQIYSASKSGPKSCHFVRCGNAKQRRRYFSQHLLYTQYNAKNNVLFWRNTTKPDRAHVSRSLARVCDKL